MRLAVVSGNRAVVGGAETYLRWLLPALVAASHEVSVFFERDADGSRTIDGDPSGMPSFTLARIGRGAWQSALREQRPELVYVHGVSDPGLESWLAENFTTVAYAHSYYGACISGTRLHTRPSIRLCQRRFGPPCLGLNYMLGCGVRRPDRLLRLYKEERARSRLLAEHAAIAVASRYVRQTYEAQGVAPSRLLLLPYPTLEWSAEDSAPAPQHGTGDVLFAGRVTALKGLDHAVRAVALAQRWLERPLRLLIAGEGPELSRSLELATKLSVSCSAPGWLSGDAKRRAFAGAEALLMPSIWAEPFGIVGIEAGALGVPAVGYGLGGIADWLLPGVSGELAEEVEPGALASALVRALSGKEHHAELSRGAWEVARRHAPEAHLGALVKALSALREQGPAPRS